MWKCVCAASYVKCHGSAEVRKCGSAEVRKCDVNICELLRFLQKVLDFKVRKFEDA